MGREAEMGDYLGRTLRTAGILERAAGLSNIQALSLLGRILDRRAAWAEDGCQLSDAVKGL